jgi:hypothetical protein
VVFCLFVAAGDFRCPDSMARSDRLSMKVDPFEKFTIVFHPRRDSPCTTADH